MQITTHYPWGSNTTRNSLRVGSIWPQCLTCFIKITNTVCIFQIDKGVGMIRVDFGPISETVYIDIILNTIIER